MFKIASLNNKNMNKFINLNELRVKFNVLNEDFYHHYSDMSCINKFFARRNVRLLFMKDDLVGYLWATSYDRKYDVINSMYVEGERCLEEKYSSLVSSLRLRKPLIYSCEKNSYNYDILSKLGFRKTEGTYEMHTKVSSYDCDFPNEIFFEPVVKGKHEKIRCYIQNEVFKNDTRIPITVDDIYYDEIQNYYYPEGAILIKKNNEYVGYGQIILNGTIPTIVNIGILKEFRGRGYGKLLMIYLLNHLKSNGFSEVDLKVSSNNPIALKLYNSLGFTLEKETHRWEYKKSTS